MIFRPMLAAKADLEKLRFPLIAQPKYDGIRCLITDGGKAVSRTLKPIPNLWVREKLAEFSAKRGGDGLDGEIITYTNGRMDDLHTVQSKVMSVEGSPQFVFHVFDNFMMRNTPYFQRHFETRPKIIRDDRIPITPWIDLVSNKMCDDMDDLMTYEEHLVANGWEGMIARDPRGLYKFGRATVNEGLLLKFKRFLDDEAVIIGFEELEHNENDPEIDERGLQKRSSHKDGKVAGGVLGALILSWAGVEFKVGSGFDAAQREELWQDRENLKGKVVTFKYKGTGPNGKPLIPSFRAIRYDSNPPRPAPKAGWSQGSLF
jgi:DNA ligase-1